MAEPSALAPAHLIRALELIPHPEGGHYRETYRAGELVQTPRGPRPASTAILYLLAAGDCSHWHRIRADELWHHHGGGGLLIYELSPAGSVRRTRLGMDLAAGERPQHGVPAASWFAAEPAEACAWGLVSCTVAPGFAFSDFELARCQQLEPHGPALAGLCAHWRRLCRQP
ncbi:MAG: cupin domain-containing protein [Cyanobacteria bacterium J06638_7]